MKMADQRQAVNANSDSTHGGAEPKIIAALTKNSREEIRICATEYANRKLVDIRVWVPGRGTDDARPTRKGISLRPELLPEMVEALAKAIRETGQQP